MKFLVDSMAHGREWRTGSRKDGKTEGATAAEMGGFVVEEETVGG